MRLFNLIKKSKTASLPANRWLAAFEADIAYNLKQHPGNPDLGFAAAVGSPTLAAFREQGDGHVAVLKAHGLTDDMAIFDLGCGCGRTAQALRRAGWRGQYSGTDIVECFVTELKAKCPGFTATVHRQPSIPVADNALDMLFHWSVFTHISPEECYVYMADSFRALKPGAKMIYSFLELDDPSHQDLFFHRAGILARGSSNAMPDTFLHRDWIRLWASRIGFSPPAFHAGNDTTRHPAFWQTLTVMTKPASASVADQR